MISQLQPRRRSKLRAKLGIFAYSVKKHSYWKRYESHFVCTQTETVLPYIIFTHKTPLLRELAGVDMQYQRNKVTNLNIASRTINGVLITPKQRFSYWKRIGALTKRKGYIDGIELYYGTFRPGIGGGLCQMSNLIYWMFLHTPLRITERHRHSYDVFPDSRRKLPFGSGATCYYPFMDLEAVNETGQTFQICVRVTNEYLEGEIRSSEPLGLTYNIYEQDHEFRLQAWGGHTRHNRIMRDVYKGEDLIDTQEVTSNHALCMYSPFISSKAGSGLA